MAYKAITAITTAAVPQTPSNDSGKQVIDIGMSAWNCAHNEQAEDEDSSDRDCENAGKKAYLEAMPSLSGYRNICDFIACINYASMTGVVTHNEATHCLADARIALSTIYHNPNHIHERKREKSEKKKKI